MTSTAEDSTPPSSAPGTATQFGAARVAANITSLTPDWWNTTTGTVWTVLQTAPVPLLTIRQLAASRART
jgi:hypothetical protein